MTKLIYQEDQVAIDPARITLETDDTFGPMTVFHDVIIASEIVQEYPDGFAFKPGDELEAATWTWEGRWITVGGHPDTPVVMDRDQIGGRTVNLRFKKDLKDKTRRPMRRGIMADLQIFDNKITPELLSDMKSGKKPDVSIGFFFERDETPGTVQDGTLKGEAFDYVQRKIFGDHTAVGIDNGRCPNPFCGLGADEINDEIVGDPFAGFKNFKACQKKIKEKNPKLSAERVDKICGALKAKSEEKEDVMMKASRVLRAMLEDEIESLQGEEDATEGKEWWEMLDWNAEDMKEAFDNLGETLQDQIIAAGLCPDCASKSLAADLSLEEIDAKLKELKKKRDDLRERVRAIEDKLFTEPPAERKRKKDLRNQINQLWDEMGDLSDEIRAFTEAKSIKITQSALTDEYDEFEKWVIKEFGKDAALTSAQKRALPDSDYAFIEKGCKKVDGKTEQKCRHFPIPDAARVRAALAALKGARTGKIPKFAKQAKPKICSAAKKFKIESDVCKTKKKADAKEKLDSYAVLEKATKVLGQVEH